MSHVRAKKNGKTLHLKTFMGGKMTPQQVHQLLAWGGRRCDQCGDAAVIRCISFAPLIDLKQKAPDLLAKIAVENEGQIPIVEFTYGKFVRIGQAYACHGHKKSLEVSAAHGPSWVLVEWDRGPDPTAKVTEQVVEVPEKKAS